MRVDSASCGAGVVLYWVGLFFSGPPIEAARASGVGPTALYVFLLLAVCGLLAFWLRAQVRA